MFLNRDAGSAFQHSLFNDVSFEEAFVDWLRKSAFKHTVTTSTVNKPKDLCSMKSRTHTHPFQGSPRCRNCDHVTFSVQQSRAAMAPFKRDLVVAAHAV